MNKEQNPKTGNKFFNFLWYLLPMVCLIFSSEASMNIALAQAILGYLMQGIIIVCFAIMALVWIGVGDDKEIRAELMENLRKLNKNKALRLGYQFLNISLAFLFAAKGEWFTGIYWMLALIINFLVFHVVNAIDNKESI